MSNPYPHNSSVSQVRTYVGMSLSEIVADVRARFVLWLQQQEGYPPEVENHDEELRHGIDEPTVA